jgi:hypothetical protein
MRSDTIGAFFWVALYCGLGLLAHCTAGCIPEGPPCPGGEQLPSGSCLRGETQEAAWVSDIEAAIGLPRPVDIWLYEDGNDVTASFEAPIPEGGCVNGWYLDGQVVAIPGTLAHELMHAYSDQVGLLRPVNPTPGRDYASVYAAQHTPEFGWLDGFDREVTFAYAVHGWPESIGSEVCDGW